MQKLDQRSIETEELILEYSHKLLEALGNRGHMVNPNVEIVNSFERIMKEFVKKLREMENLV